MSWRRCWVAAVMAALVLLPAPAVAAEKKTNVAVPNAAAVANEVQAYYRQLVSYRARFKQSYWARVHNKKNVFVGTVAFVKRGKFSFRYRNGNRVVSNGKVVKVYHKRQKRLYRSRLDRSQYPAALAFLFGKGRLVRDFKLRLVNPKRTRLKRGWLLEAIPHEATPAYVRLLLYIGDAYHVHRVLLLDAHGNTNRFDFLRPVVNAKIPNKEFRFRPPVGTKVVRP